MHGVPTAIKLFHFSRMLFVKRYKLVFLTEYERTLKSFDVTTHKKPMCVKKLTCKKFV